MPDQMRITADETKIYEFFQRPRTRFQIPDYQRRYSWKEKQWSDFWNDLSSVVSNSRQHFLGSVVVIEDDEGWIDEYELVDGQQRLTTISLLLKIIQEKYSDMGESGKAADVDDNLHFSRDSEIYRRLILNQFDDEDYDNLLNERDALLSDQNDNQLVKAYYYFSQKLESVENIDDIYDALISSMSVVEIRCEGELTAMRLFETLNNRGLDLSPVDLMKNHLIYIGAERDEIDTEAIKKYWARILNNLIGKISQMEQFFIHYLMGSPIVDINESISKNTLYDFFCESVSEIIDSNEWTVETYIQDICTKSSLYAAMVDCNLTNSDIDLYKPHIQEINAKLRDFEALSARSVRTLLLRALYEYDDKDDIMSTIRMTETFITRRRVVGRASGSNENKAFTTVCSEAFGASSPLSITRNILESETPSDREFRSALQNEGFANSDKTVYILDMMERHHFASDGIGISRYNVDIEHIAPRNITADKYTNWVQYLNVDGETFEREYCNRLGNLTLLEDSSNARAQDNPFEQKKHEYENSAFQMTQELTEIDNWSIEQIEDRSEQLSEIAVLIWNYTDV